MSRGPQVPLGPKVNRAPTEWKDQRGRRDLRVHKVQRDLKVYRDHPVPRHWTVSRRSSSKSSAFQILLTLWLCPLHVLPGYLPEAELGSALDPRTPQLCFRDRTQTSLRLGLPSSTTSGVSLTGSRFSQCVWTKATAKFRSLTRLWSQRSFGVA